MPGRCVRVLKRRSLHQVLQRLLVILVGILLGVMLHDPPAQMMSHLLVVAALVVEPGIHLLLIHHAQRLQTRHALEAEKVVDSSSLCDIVLPSDVKAGCKGYSVLNRLCAAVTTRGQERVRRVAELYHLAARRCPGWLWVAPHEFPVDKLVRRRAFDDAVGDFGPVGNSGGEFEGFIRRDAMSP
jgi:hypothetical protein